MENNNFVITNSITSGDLISSDDNNTLSIGNDGKLFAQPSLQPNLSTPSINRDTLYEGVLRANATQQLSADVNNYSLIMVCATVIASNIVHHLWTTIISEESDVFCIH